VTLAADRRAQAGLSATQKVQTEFAGRRGRLFWLALKTSFFTILTLGLYRFWMKTRIRRYYWSSIRPGGIPLEYTGDPLEKLLGFLIAVVFLAFYIGIVNLILMFASFAILHSNVFAYILTFVGVAPFFFYAQYRARRYMLARTRWRGLRFGLEPGAWGYSWRAVVHWLITIATLGLLWPRMTFWLEKYKTDRTFFGSVRLRQGGRWTMLFPCYIPMLLAGAILVAGVLAVYTGMATPLEAFVIVVPFLAYGIINYRVKSLRILANAKTADGVGLFAEPRQMRVLGIYLLGGALVALGLGLIAFGFGVVIAMMVQAGIRSGEFPSTMNFSVALMSEWRFMIIALLFYFAFFLLWGVLVQVLITLPRLRHYAETLTVTGADHLPGITQRPRDEFAEAEGFAEALDVGAAL